MLSVNRKPDNKMNKQIQQTPPKIVAIAFGYIPHYRKEFYYGLKEALDKKNIILKVIYGQPNKRDMLKGDMVEIPWGIRIENKILQIGDKELYWQPILPYIKDADLVIVEPGSRLLVNYLLLLRSIFGNPKLAFWGFGVHFHKSKAIPISEWVKRFITKKVHWYFAYTERVVDIVSEMGYPKERITVVYNSIDTRNLIKTRNRVTNKELADLKSRLSVKGNHIGLYIGAMYKEKKLKFLIESCKLIRQQVHDFEMLMIGAGTDAYLVRDAVSENPWIHYLGPKFNEEKVPFFAISKLFL
jgi:glycosyltransferase involved in cell wall biosynthesis